MVQRLRPVPVGVQAHDSHVDAFERGLVVGEVATCFDRPPDPSVHRLDRVGGADHPADLRVEREERDELSPSLVPEPDDRRVTGAPRLDELGEPFAGGGFGWGGIDGFEGFGDLLPVLAAGITEAVAQ